MRNLEALIQDVNQEVFISIITANLPKDILVHLEIQKGAKNKWTVGKLRELFNDCVYAKEKAEQHINTGISTSRQQASHPLRLSTEAWLEPRAKFSDHAGSVTEITGTMNV